MKKNYRISERVKVINPNAPCYQLEGTVLSNNTNTSFKPLNIIVDGGCGSWQLNYSEVESLEKQDKSEVKPDIKLPVKAVKKEVIKTEKRPYKKREKETIEKPKRKYNKKVKAELDGTI